MNRLKDLRLNYNMTQKEIAKQLHITRSAYAQYESGIHQPPLEVMERLADFYHVNLEYLCGRTEYAKPMTMLEQQHSEFLDAMSDISEIDRQALLYILNRLQLSEQSQIAEKSSWLTKK